MLEKLKKVKGALKDVSKSIQMSNAANEDDVVFTVAYNKAQEALTLLDEVIKSKTTITDEMVERAAKAMYDIYPDVYEYHRVDAPEPWLDLVDFCKETYRKLAKASLQAALEVE